MSVNLSPTTAALPPGGQQASQNLFEHMASAASGAPGGASPHHIGESLMQRLDGFMDRSHAFNARADALAASPASPATVQASPATATPPPSTASTAQVDQLVHSLGKMFDYSIETQMVVRGATQISGSANTLLKGQ